MELETNTVIQRFISLNPIESDAFFKLISKFSSNQFVELGLSREEAESLYQCWVKINNRM